MVSGPAVAGSVATTEPTTYRASGSSVVTATTTSPRTPCARTTEPITSSIASGRRSVGVDDVDADLPTADRGDDLAECLGGAAVAADHRTKILRMHPDLEALATTGVDEPDAYVIRVVDDALDQVLERRPEGGVRPGR